MICILHHKTYSYVPSVHPFLFNELSKRQADDFHVIDIGTKTLKQIREQIAHVSLLVIDQSVLNALHITSGKMRKKITYMYLPNLKEVEFYSTLLHHIINLSVPVLHWFSITDAHGVLTVDLKKITHANIQVETYLQRISGIIWGYRSEKLTDIKKVPSHYAETWFDESENPVESYKTIARHIKYDIEIIHCLNKTEFFTAKKKWDIDVPGVTYKTRKIVQEILKEHTFSSPKKNSQLLIGKLNGLIKKSRLLPPTFIFKNNYLAMRYYISRCRSCFVCGSSLRYFVRKFLEVPAFESVMLAYPPVNMSDYGFIDNIHYVHTEPEEIAEKLEWLLNDEEIQLRIIHAAKQLVHQQHTDSVRASQLVKALRFVSKDEITTAHFNNGRYTYYNREKEILTD